MIRLQLVLLCLLLPVLAGACVRMMDEEFECDFDSDCLDGKTCRREARTLRSYCREPGWCSDTTPCPTSAQSCRDNLCVCEPRPETCNGLDDDCDGQVDEGLSMRVGTETAALPCQRLIWQRATSGLAVGRQEAIDYCQRLSLERNIGWRLPTEDEYRALFGSSCGSFDYCGSCSKARPCNEVILSPSDTCWVKAETTSSYGNFAFALASGTDVFVDSSSDKYFVRCVFDEP